jgi:hypothetical protein
MGLHRKGGAACRPELCELHFLSANTDLAKLDYLTVRRRKTPVLLRRFNQDAR